MSTATLTRPIVAAADPELTMPTLEQIIRSDKEYHAVHLHELLGIPTSVTRAARLSPQSKTFFRTHRGARAPEFEQMSGRDILAWLQSDVAPSYAITPSTVAVWRRTNPATQPTPVVEPRDALQAASVILVERQRQIKEDAERIEREKWATYCQLLVSLDADDGAKLADAMQALSISPAQAAEHREFLNRFFRREEEVHATAEAIARREGRDYVDVLPNLQLEWQRECERLSRQQPRLVEALQSVL